MQAEPADASAGPVMAGRTADAIRELPHSLQSAIGPVTSMARAVLDEFRRARPDSMEIEFGVDLAAQAGAVIAKSEAGCHLRVTLTWNAAESAADGAGENPD
ncbi:CU044_2847 family protein [Streptomyces sp. NPDC003374]